MRVVFFRFLTDGFRRCAVTMVVAMMCCCLYAERQELGRYQSVIDRQMFGQPPPGFDPTRPPSEVSAKEERAKEQELTKEQEQLKSAIHFSMINETPSGATAVGFTDNSDSKNPKHYYLKVGESRDGWTVKEADALKAEMTVAKGEIEVTLTLGGNSASGGGATKRVGAPNGRPGISAPSAGRPAMRSGGMNNGLGSLRERRAMRKQQREAEEQAAAEAKAQREAAAAEKEAQREAERAAEKAQRDKEREEQRAQLLQIQEELKKAREEKAKAKEESKETDEGDEEG